MAETENTENESEEEPKKKGSKLPLILGVVLALVGGGGGFFAVSSGMILSSGNEHSVDDHVGEMAELPAVAFVAMDPLVISLPNPSRREHLRFRAHLEVKPGTEADVEAILPRVVDVLNGYLRAVEVSQLEDPTALTRLRAQMLRRVQVVVGEGRVRDLLIMEFVLN
jgi:flagellar FliL protein